MPAHLDTLKSSCVGLPSAPLNLCIKPTFPVDVVGSREIDSLPNSVPRGLELPSALKVESGTLLTIGQRSRSQHRFSPSYDGIRYKAHRGEVLLLLKGNLRIIVIIILRHHSS